MGLGTPQTPTDFRHMSSSRSTSDGGGPVSRKEFRIGRSQGNLARTPDVAVVISLKLVYTPVDDNVTMPHKSQVTSHKSLTVTEMEDRRATVTDALQSTTFRLYSSAAAPVTGAAAPRHPLPRCQGTKCRPGTPGILKYVIRSRSFSSLRKGIELSNTVS